MKNFFHAPRTTHHAFLLLLALAGNLFAD
ncbi:MAG: hypothetical protein RLZZ350_123, partial [Verrucomicrobiota bacterium]